MPLALTLGKRLMLFVCICLVCFFIVAVFGFIIPMVFSEPTPAMRIVIILQDVFLFIVPPVATALLVTRRPASLLCIDRPIAWLPLVLAACTLVAAVPAMNFVIYLNEHVPLPESIAAVLTAMEEQARESVEMLMGAHDIPNLLLSILIVGVFAGVSEELLFRGGLQRLLVTGHVNPHVAIWISAFVFSFVHMQFYGFVPRMLLGAFFGYLLWWTHTLWVPIIIHALNNTMYLVAQYISDAGSEHSALDSIGYGADALMVVVSVALTVIGLCLLYRNRTKSAA